MESGNDFRRPIGKEGEDIACRLLEERGHVILERNWRSGHLEIDIISCDKDGIHFVEVKARRHSIQAPPQENVNAQKQKKIVKAAQSYLRKGKGAGVRNKECMFDVIAVTFREHTVTTEYFEQAYIPIFI